MALVIAPSSQPIQHEKPIEDDFQCEIIPDGFEWAMFGWDKERSSKKLNIDDDELLVKVKDGSGFKTSIGDTVS